MTLYILNAIGETVRKIGPINKNGANEITVDLAGLPAGVYYVSAISSRMKTQVLGIIKL